MGESVNKQEYFEEVPDNSSFELSRSSWRKKIYESNPVENGVIQFQKYLDGNHYAYQWEWMGIPIIKLPDDVMVIQEFFYKYRPSAVIEVGVARGGGIALSASLMKINEIKINILGIDLKIFPHTQKSLDSYLGTGVELIECDSTSELAIDAIKNFVVDEELVLVILDSDHSHDHVLKELSDICPLLPIGSRVLVADTIIEYFVSENTNRSWAPGNSPASALKQFLNNNDDWEIDIEWSRRAVISESRDGWIKRIKA